MNKEQTDHFITLCLSAIVFTLGLISVYLYVNGVFDPYLDNAFILLGLTFGTLMAIGMGGLTVILSMYNINDARTV